MIEPSLLRKVATTMLVLAVPFAVAFLIGDLSTTSVDDPDYFIRPPDIPDVAALVLGMASLVLVVTSTAVLVWAWRREPPQPGLVSVLVPLLILGVIAGAVWRVFTAEVIGANIGAGVLVLFGWPIVLALVAFAGIMAWVRR
jgi:hypothetical protein